MRPFHSSFSAAADSALILSLSLVPIILQSIYYKNPVSPKKPHGTPPVVFLRHASHHRFRSRRAIPRSPRVTQACGRLPARGLGPGDRLRRGGFTSFTV